VNKNLKEFQSDFIKQVLAVNAPVEFKRYGDCMIQAQVSALELTFPTFAAWVGADCADALFRTFILDRPSKEPDLNQRGARFQEWFAAFMPNQIELARHPYLLDLIAIEWAIEGVKSAENSRSSLPLSDIIPSRMATLKIIKQPCVSVLTSVWPLNQLIRLSEASNSVHLTAVLQSKELLGFAIFRKQNDVMVKSITESEADRLGALSEGLSIYDAAQLWGTATLQNDLSRWLSLNWIYLA